MDQSLRCMLLATLCCFLYLVKASEDDLLDFDFTDLKEIDWNYDTDSGRESLSKGTTEKNIITFDDDSDLLEENEVHPFDWREKVLRTALSKALANKEVRQKFIEVVPILRVLTKQQRLALSALITAQINAKKGKELKLDQVRMMFGDDKSLLLPIVFDIANLVRNSAKKYIEIDYNLADFGDFSKPKISYERRNLKLAPEELTAEENNEGVGTLPASAQMTQVIGLDGLEEFMSEEVLDPREINEELEILKMEKKNNTNLDDVNFDLELEEEDDITDPLDINIGLQKDVPTFTLLKLNKTQTRELLRDSRTTTEKPKKKVSHAYFKTSLKRNRRSARDSREFVHKLVRSVPLTVNEEDLQRGSAGRTLKLNTTAFASPKEITIRAASLPSTLSTSVPTTKAPIIVTPETTTEETYEPYQLEEDFAFANFNGSEILIDEESDNEENDLVSEVKSEPNDEILPTPEELIAGPLYRISGNKLLPIRKKVNKRKRVPVRARPKSGSSGNGVLPPKKCERFTASMCIKTEDYPIDHIMSSIRRHRNAMTALLAEYDDKPLNTMDTTDDFDEYLYSKKRRQDTDLQSNLCQSIIRYARPQKARSASGEWKYIVNTGQHTQTLRLEKCMSPQESCSYLASSYRSHCVQVYNYHRLLSWDKIRGLHVDIFKVPTCCSCQIDGYKQQMHAFLRPINKDFTQAYKGNLYRQQQQQALNNNGEEDDENDDLDLSFAIKRKHHKDDNSFDANELSSNRIKAKVPSPTVGAYLSPPVSEAFEEDYGYKVQRETASISKQQQFSVSSSASSQLSNNHYLRDMQSRSPHQFYKGSGSDQDFAPSEQHAEREVNDFGKALGKAESTHEKSNKNNNYVTQTAHTGSSSVSDSSTTAIPASTGTIRAFTTPSTIRYRRPTIIDTNAHQKPSVTATKALPTVASSPAAATTRAATTLPVHTNRTASLPTHYYTRSRHVLKNQSRFRIPYTITSANKGRDCCQETNATAADEFELEEPTTTDSPPSTQQTDIYAVNQNIFKNYYKNKFSLAYTPAPTLNNSSSSLSSPPKRINYNYHPIIDFFEYNKRITASTPTTTPTTPQPLFTASENNLSSSTHSYPQEIYEPNPVFNFEQPSQVHNYKTNKQHDNQQHKQQFKYRAQHTERRIGYGVAATAVAAATDGDGISRRSSSTVLSNTPKQSTNSKISSGKSLYSVLATPTNSVAKYEPPVEPNIWHPVIVQHF